MRIELWGMNHRTAPVAVREKVSVPPANLVRELRAFCGAVPAEECVIVSTCNRFEIYTARAAAGQSCEVARFLEVRHGFAPEEFSRCLYHYDGEDAVRHLFRVTASLDSMIVGEAQIFGQVREAYRAALKAGFAGAVLGRLFEEAFKTAREARARTRIGKGAISVSSLSIRLATALFGALAQRRVLVIGAGQTGESAARHLVSRGIKSVTVANRTFARARELAAGFSGTAVGFDRLYDAIAQADLVVSSTGSPHPIVRAAPVERLMRRRSAPLLFIDIAVPRDIDPAVATVRNVHLYNIDDLDRMREANMRERLVEAAMAERLVAERARAVLHGAFWRSAADGSPALPAERCAGGMRL